MPVPRNLCLGIYIRDAFDHLSKGEFTYHWSMFFYCKRAEMTSISLTEVTCTQRDNYSHLLKLGDLIVLLFSISSR